MHLLIDRDLVRETSDLAMSLRASQRFCIDYFSCSHFDEWWTAQEDLRMVLDKDAVVGQCWMIRATRSR